MTQLTEERFEQLLDKKFDEKLAPLATKQDVREGVEELARMVADGFADVQKRLDVTSRMTTLEKQMTEIRAALHLSS